MRNPSDSVIVMAMARMNRDSSPYHLAQRAMADLKAAVWLALREAPEDGLRNADLGRALGIYGGHEGHEGHISRTVLHIMQSEGVVSQDPKTSRWSLVAAAESNP